MTSLRLDNVLIVVEDLEASIAFFEVLGMELEGRTTVEGEWVDRTIGINNAKGEIATMKTPDGVGRVELDKFYAPSAITPEPHPSPVNTLGYRRIMFEVDDIDGVLGRLQAHGAELVDEVVNYENVYRLCYVRGPEGLLIGIAEKVTG